MLLLFDFTLLGTVRVRLPVTLTRSNELTYVPTSMLEELLYNVKKTAVDSMVVAEAISPDEFNFGCC